jgi:hypothetical protein
MYRFDFDSQYVDAAALIQQLPGVVQVEDEDEFDDEPSDYTFKVECRSVAVQISAMLTADDISFYMRVQS